MLTGMSQRPGSDKGWHDGKDIAELNTSNVYTATGMCCQNKHEGFCNRHVYCVGVLNSVQNKRCKSVSGFHTIQTPLTVQLDLGPSVCAKANIWRHTDTVRYTARGLDGVRARQSLTSIDLSTVEMAHPSLCQTYDMLPTSVPGCVVVAAVDQSGQWTSSFTAATWCRHCCKRLAVFRLCEQKFVCCGGLHISICVFAKCWDATVCNACDSSHPLNAYNIGLTPHRSMTKVNPIELLS